MEYFDTGFGGSDRTSLLASFNGGSPSVFGSMTGGSNTSPWGSLIGGGLSILNNWLMTRNQGGGGGNNFGATPPFLPAAGAASAAALIPTLIAAGARVAGNVVRISRAAYASLSPAIKAAIVASGLSILIDNAFDGVSSGSSGSGRRRRAKGITGTELRGFRKMSKLLRKEGMRPKAIGGGSRRRVCK